MAEGVVSASTLASAAVGNATFNLSGSIDASLAAANRFEFHDKIVINEIMYNARPTYATAAVIRPEAILAIDDTWQYDDSGTDQGTAWREPGFDDSSWSVGSGLFFVETGPLPGPKNTPCQSASKWRIQGTHGGSEVIDDPAQPGNQLLRLVADARISYLSNHAETTLSNCYLRGRGSTIARLPRLGGGKLNVHFALRGRDGRCTVASVPVVGINPQMWNRRVVFIRGATGNQLSHPGTRVDERRKD